LIVPIFALAQISTPLAQSGFDLKIPNA